MLAGRIAAGHGFEQTAPEAHGEIGLGRLIDELEMSCQPTDLFHGVTTISIPASHHAEFHFSWSSLVASADDNGARGEQS